MINSPKSPLARIERGLGSLGRSVLLDALHPGLAGPDFRQLLGSCGLATDVELEGLYGWRNGTDAAVKSLDDIQIFPGYHFLSIESALADYRSFVADPRWDPRWLPIFANGGGYFYVVELAGTGAGAVRHFQVDESEYPVEFESVNAMLETIARGFEQAVFFVDSRGYLEMDDAKFATLAAAANPSVPWWND